MTQGIGIWPFGCTPWAHFTCGAFLESVALLYWNGYKDQDVGTKCSPWHPKPPGLPIACLLQSSLGSNEHISAVTLRGTHCLYGNERQEEPGKDAAERTVWHQEETAECAEDQRETFPAGLGKWCGHWMTIRDPQEDTNKCQFASSQVFLTINVFITFYL